MGGIRFIGLTLALVGLVASACGGTTTPGATTSAAPTQATVTKDLIIGFTASQTGAQNVTSKRQTDGIQLWVDDVTKVGGIKLKDGTVLMPKVKFYDDESKTDRVQALYTKLINDDKLLLRFDAFVLSNALGCEIYTGKIIHGHSHARCRVTASPLYGEVRKHITAIGDYCPVRRLLTSS